MPFKSLQIFVIAPVCFFIFLGLLSSEYSIKFAVSWISYGIFAITIATLVSMVSNLIDLKTYWLNLSFNRQINFIVYHDSIKFESAVFSSIAYGIPLFISKLLIANFEGKFYERFLIYFVIFLMMMVVVLSGEPVLWTTAILSPFFALLFIYFLCGSSIQKSWSFVSKICLFVFVIFSFFILDSGLPEPEKALKHSSISPDYNSIETSHSTNLDNILASVQERPFIGQGLGFKSPQNFGNGESWEYTLFGGSLLERFGIAGFLVYYGVLLWLFFKGYHLTRGDPEFAKVFYPLITAFFVLAVFNSQSGDSLGFNFLVGLFLPLAVINARLCSYSRNVKSMRGAGNIGLLR